MHERKNTIMKIKVKDVKDIANLNTTLDAMTEIINKQANSLKAGIFGNVGKDIADIIKSKMFLSIQFAYHSLMYASFCVWLRHKAPKLRNIDHMVLVTGNENTFNILSNDNERLEKQNKISTVYPTVCKVSKYGWIVIKPTFPISDVVTKGRSTPIVTVYFIGKDAYKNRHEYIQCHYKYIKYRSNINADRVAFSEVNNDGGTSGYGAYKKRREDIVWDKLDELSNYILQWSNMRDDYVSRHLPYKLSILLYGKPGTGKSSVCNYIAGLTNRTLEIVRPSVSIEGLKHSQRYESDRILLFEDIDIFFEQSQSLSISTGNGVSVDNTNDKLHYLLQMFSGLDTPNNLIIICTTNYPEKLDERLLRPGRFDLIYEIPEFDKKNAVEMCEMYDVPSDVLLKNMGDTINPSELWSKCIQYSIQERVKSMKENLP